MKCMMLFSAVKKCYFFTYTCILVCVISTQKVLAFFVHLFVFFQSTKNYKLSGQQNMKQRKKLWPLYFSTLQIHIVCSLKPSKWIFYLCNGDRWSLFKNTGERNVNTISIFNMATWIRAIRHWRFEWRTQQWNSRECYIPMRGKFSCFIFHWTGHWLPEQWVGDAVWYQLPSQRS